MLSIMMTLFTMKAKLADEGKVSDPFYANVIKEIDPEGLYLVKNI